MFQIFLAENAIGNIFILKNFFPWNRDVSVLAWCRILVGCSRAWSNTSYKEFKLDSASMYFNVHMLVIACWMKILRYYQALSSECSKFLSSSVLCLMFYQSGIKYHAWRKWTNLQCRTNHLQIRYSFVKSLILCKFEVCILI